MASTLFFTPEFMVALAVFLGGLVAGFAGFGLASAAGAILLHVQDPAMAVPLMMICSVIAQTGGLLYLGKAIEWRTSVPFVVGGMVGVPIAIAVFSSIDADSFRRGFGAFLVLYAGYTLCRQSVAAAQARAAVAAPSGTVEGGAGAVVLSRATGATQMMVGFGGGFVGGLTAMPGALVTVWCDLQKRSKTSQRGVVQPFILAMQICALLVMAGNTDLLREDVLHQVGLSLPFLASGTALGLFLFGKVDNAAFRTVVLMIILLSGSGLVLH